MQNYRTTFTAKPLVAKAIKDKAARDGKSISEVVNDLLQEALGLNTGKSSRRPKFKVVPFNLELKPGLDPARMSQILYDLEVEQE